MGGPAASPQRGACAGSRAALARAHMRARSTGGYAEVNASAYPARLLTPRLRERARGMRPRTARPRARVCPRGAWPTDGSDSTDEDYASAAEFDEEEVSSLQCQEHGVVAYCSLSSAGARARGRLMSATRRRTTRAGRYEGWSNTESNTCRGSTKNKRVKLLTGAFELTVMAVNSCDESSMLCFMCAD